MRTDRRRIQTAVLGGADSDEPLMLPMEAIELDAFRRAHEDDAFWCGTLLGTRKSLARRGTLVKRPVW